MFPYSDLDSPLNMSLDTIRTIPIGEHHLTPSWYPITILGIVGATGQIQLFCVQIHDPLKNEFRYKLNHPNRKRPNFQTAGFSKVFCILQPN
jgi:hypothetical protein